MMRGLYEFQVIYIYEIKYHNDIYLYNIYEQVYVFVFCHFFSNFFSSYSRRVDVGLNRSELNQHRLKMSKTKY